MNDNRITLDTNILIYAANADAGARHHLAIKVLVTLLLVQEEGLSIQQVSHDLGMSYS